MSSKLIVFYIQWKLQIKLNLTIFKNVWNLDFLLLTQVCYLGSYILFDEKIELIHDYSSE